MTTFEAGSRPPGVLIADDEEAICFSLARELRRHGVAVYVAADGPAALELYRAHGRRIDAIFLDVRMPRLDGPQTLAAMRQLAPEVRCCLMTAFGAAPTDSADGTPAPRMLYKPFDLDVFLSVVGQMLGGRAAESEPPD
jgi:DNA-binding NtrC family response regulator